MLAIVSLMAIWLLSSIKKKYRVRHYYSQSRYDTRTFSNENIAAVNGDPVSFLISNITSVFLIQEEIIPSILTYIAINRIIFVMMMNTFNNHPIIFFMVVGIDIVNTKAKQFLMNLNVGDKDSSTIQKFMEEEKDVWMGWAIWMRINFSKYLLRKRAQKGSPGVTSRIMLRWSATIFHLFAPVIRG